MRPGHPRDARKPVSGRSRRRRGALLVLAACLAGCGYTTGFQLAPEYGSVGVEVFANDSLEPDLERDLHLELTRSARNLLSAPVRPPGNADLVIRGRILNFRRRPGLRSGGNLLQETAVRIQVEAELWDRRSGETVAGPLTFERSVGYALDARGQELEALGRTLKNLADRVVLDLVPRLHAPDAARTGEPAPEPR